MSLPLLSVSLVLLTYLCNVTTRIVTFLLSVPDISPPPLELHLTTSELWFGQEQEGILP